MLYSAEENGQLSVSLTHCKAGKMSNDDRWERSSDSNSLRKDSNHCLRGIWLARRLYEVSWHTKTLKKNLTKCISKTKYWSLGKQCSHWSLHNLLSPRRSMHDSPGLLSLPFQEHTICQHMSQMCTSLTPNEVVSLNLGRFTCRLHNILHYFHLVQLRSNLVCVSISNPDFIMG